MPNVDLPDWPEDALDDVALDWGVQDRHKRNRGLAIDDFDRDGRIDVFAVSPSEGVTVWQRRATGWAGDPRPPMLMHPTAVATADYDADGDLDLFVTGGGHHGPAPDTLLRNDGAGTDGFIEWSDVSEAVGIAGFVRASFGAAWADYDLDGDLDVYVSTMANFEPPSEQSANLLFRNEDGYFTDVAVAAGVEGVFEARAPIWLDGDEDGRPDLYVPAFGEDNRYFHNLGDGLFVDRTDLGLASPTYSWAAAAADFDGDGHIDVVASGRSDWWYGDDDELPEPVRLRARHALYLGDGLDGWRDVAEASGFVDDDDPASFYGAMGYQIGDLDGDGWFELMSGNGRPENGEADVLGTFWAGSDGLRWKDRRSAVDFPAPQDGLEPAYEPYPYRTHGIVFADLDGDDAVDVWVGEGGMESVGGSSFPTGFEPDRVFRNTMGPPASWLQVTLSSGSGNRDAIGARIDVRDADGATLTRWNWPQSGFNSSQSVRPRIGLGDRPGPFTVAVRWPSGTESTHGPFDTGAIQLIEPAVAGR